MERDGEEFRADLRPPARAHAGAANASGRRILSAAEPAPFTQLSDARSLAALAQSALAGAEVRDQGETLAIVFAPPRRGAAARMRSEIEAWAI